jgi:integrase/recombinase XerD
MTLLGQCLLLLANNISLVKPLPLVYELPMLSEFFESRVRIQALRDGPAGSLLESFAQALSEAGYVRRIARRYLRAAEHFIYWTDRHEMPLCKVNEQSFARFDRHLSRCRCQHYGHADQWTVGRGARMFLTYLQDTSIITPPSSVKPPIHDPALLSAFCQWMRQQRGTCDVTLYTYSIYIRELLRRLGEQPSRFDARQLRAFILEKSQSCGWPTAKNCAKVLRVFLRFLIAKGQCAVGLDDAIPTLAHWRLASLPRYLAPEDVERLIASCDRASSVDRRDRAILLLLARLGLRAGDIVHLRLSDIDWKNASIQVCGKGRRHARLPLTQEVGQAIVAYLKKGRPRTNADTLFIHCRAPYCALRTPGAVTMIVDKAFRRSGVVRPSPGAAHLLRHSLATALLWKGSSLEDIAAILRHCSMETTQIYAKVDIPALRKIAQPWPEAQAC